MLPTRCAPAVGWRASLIDLYRIFLMKTKPELELADLKLIAAAAEADSEEDFLDAEADAAADPEQAEF